MFLHFPLSLQKTHENTYAERKPKEKHQNERKTSVLIFRFTELRTPFD